MPEAVIVSTARSPVAGHEKGIAGRHAADAMAVQWCAPRSTGSGAEPP